MTAPLKTVATITPTMKYRDAPAAIEWLCRAFGFEKHAVYPNAAGEIEHAQLTFGNGMIMLSSTGEGGWNPRFVQPSDVGGRQTMFCCVSVADPDAHHARAVAAGAVVVDPLADQDYGGRAYSCTDPEGYLWWFGSYDPWAPAG